ncbi:amino acid transporter [Rhizorhapis suberifaciens]|uniref:Amino acid transporter n=1 Tax=Rhizorhapis suberifaciens TaxID=13656 RepID=A0A840HYW0_9SPHN|nr:amino acid transporter [Rhizorhapis suberifaciens]
MTIGRVLPMLLSFAVAGLICVCAALTYAEVATMIPAAGSAYTYSYVVVGELFACHQSLAERGLRASCRGTAPAVASAAHRVRVDQAVKGMKQSHSFGGLHKSA